MSDQWIRRANLIVSSGTEGLDLSELRFTFKTKASDAQTPNKMHLRIYNVKRETAEALRKREFTTVSLQAGYESGNFGIIFSGTIVQVMTGRERNTDSFLDIVASDGDQWYAWAVICQSIESGQTPQQVIESIVKVQSVNGVNALPLANDATGLIEGSGLGVVKTIRGVAKFGLARDFSRDWAAKYGYRWNIENGKFSVVKNTGYRPGEAVVLSSASGLVGTPEAINDSGLKVRSLLNPAIRIGRLIQIDQENITHITMQRQGFTGAEVLSAVPTTAQGFYRVLVSEFSGDSRGGAWYVDLTCLGVDITAPDQSKSVPISA